VYADGALGSACRKTRLCSFYSQGFCSRGSSCNFAHGEEELQRTPDLSRTKLCPNLLKYGECRRGAECRHAHSLAELRPVSEALPADAIADALTAEWDRRMEAALALFGQMKTDSMSEMSTDASDGEVSEASTSECLSRSCSAEFADSELNQAPFFVSPGVTLVDESFLDVVDRLTEGNRLLFAPTGMPLAIRNTFFDVDDLPRPRAARRSQSADARLAVC